MELTPQEKKAILDQRLKQFAVEKYNHEVNKTILETQAKDLKGEDKEHVEAEVGKVDEAIAIIDKAIETTASLSDELVVEVVE